MKMSVKALLDKIMAQIYTLTNRSWVGFPNYSSRIQTIGTTGTWTASEDCWLVGILGSSSNPLTTGNTSLTVGGFEMLRVHGDHYYSGVAAQWCSLCVPVKKGQVIKLTGNNLSIGLALVRKQ